MMNAFTHLIEQAFEDQRRRGDFLRFDITVHVYSIRR